MSVGDLLEIESQYQNRGWGVRKVVERYVRVEASTHPAQVGEMLSMVGVKEPLKMLDSKRQVARGTTDAFLRRVTDRRNQIAHQGDRSGRGRAQLGVDELKGDLASLESVVAAIEAVVSTQRSSTGTRERTQDNER